MTIDPTPYTPDDEEIFSAYADAEFGTPSVEVLIGWDRWLAARDARVRAEAVAPVLALHKPREEQVVTGDCAAEDCEHEGECPTVAFAVCAECYRVAADAYPYFGERGISSVEYPCPTVRAASIEQETQP